MLSEGRAGIDSLYSLKNGIPHFSCQEQLAFDSYVLSP